MHRAIRCRSCGERFFTAVNADTPAPSECQNCEGTYDPTEQLIADAKVAKEAQRVPKGRPQSVDPRATLPNKDS